MQRRRGCCGRSDPGGKGKDWAQRCAVFLCYENVCNGDDRCQRQKQGGAVGAAASRLRVPPKAQSRRWVPQPGFR